MGKKAAAAKKREARTQVAALPYRRSETAGLTVALVTSRETARWVLPKGWVDPGVAPHTAASREAKQEAGLVGRIERQPVGQYTYVKRLPDHDLPCTVDVFPLGVKSFKAHWREKGQRDIVWVAPEEAATLVDEPDLKALLLEFSRMRSPSAA